jgi:hypothetical protein
MEDRERSWPNQPRERVAPGLSEAEEFFSKSLELTEWFNSELSTSGSFDVGIMVATPFGKLLDALPVPAMMIDSSYKVAFANQACGSISNSYKIIQGVPFPSLVPRQRNSEKALAVLKKVLLTRKSVIAEGILEIDARKVWGRLYFRPIRIGAERYALLVVSDITAEKTSLLLKQKADSRKDFLISAANEKLAEQFRHGGRIEEALKSERDRFERLTELLKLSIAILGADGRFRYLSPDFKGLFGRIIDQFSAQRRTGAVASPEMDPRSTEILVWFAQLGNPEETPHSVRTFVLKHEDGSEKTVTCRAEKLDSGECLILCEDLTRNGHPQNLRDASPTL